jgi:ABC-type sugar transport system substrate-binding protein
MDESRESRKSGRRAVLDNARRKVERALMIQDAADELSQAAQDVLAEHPDHDALRAALARYRSVSEARSSE